MHPLEGPRLKVRRADSKIKSLRGAEKVFMRESKYEVVRAEFNPKSGEYVYRVRASSPPPSLEWGVDIGEIAHNLRSALDRLVYQLAFLNTAPKAPTGTQFPIFLIGKTTKKRNGRLIAHFEREGRRYIASLRPSHQACIERLQPYKRGQGGRTNPSWMLSEINNADKHRLIQVVGGKTGAGPAISGGSNFVYPL